jgi:hypothetical protein
MASADKKRERAEKLLGRVGKFLEPNEPITRVIRGAAGANPGGRSSAILGLLSQWLLIAFTDRNIVIVTCWPLTVRPRSFFARLPLRTRLGPVEHRDAWSVINLKEAFGDVDTWVPRRFYPYIDAHDKALRGTPDNG